MRSLDELLAEVDKWYAEEIQRAPVSQVTELYNQVHAAWQSLRNRLAVAVTGEPLVPSTSVEEPASPMDLPGTPEVTGELGAGPQGSEGPGAPDGASKTAKSPKAAS